MNNWKIEESRGQFYPVKRGMLWGWNRQGRSGMHGWVVRFDTIDEAKAWLKTETGPHVMHEAI